ncbi:TetR/AcrR family transcriptional regulator [Streptomyces ovatisporus]|uniref:TetR/AcrR family transcriptional regulator n=1 Tax=Streptomyces ovatisporus TaxID=1128682 RepID=A0ABV9AF73_9ACTN
MPKQVDHEGRRSRIADAVCLLADESGLEGVTLRDVAARAGVSMGAVQRCFATKEQMLVFAVRHIGARVRDRSRARLTSSPAQSVRTALGHALSEMSLLREENRAEARVWLAFVAKAAVSPSLAAELRSGYAQFHDTVAALLREATGRTDPHVQARTLLALADGLTTHVLVGHLSSDAAQQTLDAHLRTLWDDAPAE